MAQNPQHWKANRGGGSPPPPPPAPGGGQGNWRNRTARTGPPKVGKTGGSAMGRYLPALIGLGVLVAGVVAFLEMLKPSRFARVFVIAPDHADTLALPPNAFNAQLRDRLEKWGKDKAPDRGPVAPAPEWKPDLFRGVKEKSVALFLGLHGGLDADGNPVLLAGPGRALPLADVIDAFAGLKPEVGKLLILEPVQVPAERARGVAYNGFVTGLKKLAERIERVPNLTVACACDEFQQCWTSDEAGLSVFGHFLSDGLGGAAAAKGDSAVGAAGLLEYAADQTQRWARANRDADQTPVMLPADSWRERAARVDLAYAAHQKPQPPAGPVVRMPERLSAEWDERDKAAASLPESFAPEAWREYEAWLQRAEAFARAGRAEAADALARRAADRRGSLTARRDEAECADNGLSTRRVLGLPPGPDARPELERFRLLPEAERDAFAATLSAGLKPALAALAVREMRTDEPLDPETIARQCDLLHRLRDAHLPVEAHQLRLLNRDLGPAADPKLLQQALLARLEADSCLHPEGVGPALADLAWPYVADAVRAGDAARTRGEDLLFAEPKDAAEAASLFGQARTDYATARRDGDRVRSAIALRDRAFARLPDWADWLAAPRAADPDADRRLEALVKLARSAHELDAALASGRPLEEVAAKSADLAGHLKAAQDAQDAEARELAGARTGQENWLRLDALLRVSALPAASRRSLFDTRETVGRTLSSAQQPNLDEKRRDPFEPAGRAAKRRVDLWLAALGPYAAGVPADIPAGERWVAVAPGIESGFAKARADLAAGIPAAVQKALAQSPDQWAAALGRAATAARLLEPAQFKPEARSPVRLTRDGQTCALLCALAGRALDDRWAAFDGSLERPYYDVAATNYLRAAESFARGKDEVLAPDAQDARLKPVADGKAALKAAKANPLRVAARPIDALVEATEFAATFAVTQAPGRPAGYPVTWFERAAGTTGESDARRRLEGDTANAVGRFKLAPGAAEREPVALVCLHRGQKVRAPANVNRSGPPDVILTQRPPTESERPRGFLVRGDDRLRSGQIAVMVDVTLSMNELERGERRFELAVKAVERFLKNLPDEATVSLSIFGERGSRADCLIPVSGRYIEVLFGPARLADRPNLRRQMVGRLSDLDIDQKSALSTPIAGAARQAVTDRVTALFPSERSQLRTIVMLTDGDDNVDSNPGPNLLRALDGTGIDLQLVLFNSKASEQNTAAKNFEPLNGSDLGRFWPVADVTALDNSLRDAMLPRVAVLTPDGKKLPGLPKGLALSSESQYVPTPPIERDDVRLGIRGGREAELALRPGDRPRLGVALDGPERRFQILGGARDTLGGEAEKEVARAGGVEMGVKQSLTDSGGNFWIAHAAVERVVRDQERLKVERPALAWFEVQAAGSGIKEPRPIESESLWGYASPVYRLRSRDWPARQGRTNIAIAGNAATAKLSAWWVRSLPEPGTTLEGVPRDRLGSLKRELNLGGTSVTLTEARDDAGTLSLRFQWKDGRVLAQVQGLPAAAALEHRLYDSTKTYALRVGPLDAKDYDRNWSVQLYTLDALKAAALTGTGGAGGATVELELPAARYSNRPPERVPAPDRAELRK